MTKQEAIARIPTLIEEFEADSNLSEGDLISIANLMGCRAQDWYTKIHDAVIEKEQGMNKTQTLVEALTQVVIRDNKDQPSALVAASIIFEQAAEQLRKEAEVSEVWLREGGWKGSYRD